jgi:asparagine synthase (glutamine-hydrolysing)
MSGIAGVALLGTVGDPVEPKLLARMGDALRHRGPDDGASWLSGDGRVGLTHRRLAVLDLSAGGREPMRDPLADTCVVFDGEIYNYLEIRAELEQRGHRFRTGTDTEVLLVAYREWKEDCLGRLNGMFAFALYDEARRRLFLARDRVGEKPLYYAFRPDRLVFASELKALLQDPEVSTELDLRALNCFLAYGFVAGDLSIVRAVRKLPPAHAAILEVPDGHVRTWRYWTVPPPGLRATEEEALLQELEALLEEAVRIRLRSDVPLGAFLSGGLDSSLVVALMSRAAPQPVETFTVRFEDNTLNERRYAKLVSRHFRTQHHEVVIRPNVLHVLPELVHQLDEPFTDPSVISSYYVCRETRRSVTIALSGDGGDEVFGGYRKYLAAVRDARLVQSAPPGLWRWTASLSRLLPETSRARRYATRLGDDAVTGYVGRSLLFDRVARRRLFRPEVLDALGPALDEPEERLVASFEEVAGQDLVTRMIAADFRVYLPDDVLAKVDRLSMAVSLEVRAPLLDHRVVEFAFARVPGHLKVLGAGKLLLTRLGHRLLPRELPLDRKAAFGIPVRTWLARHPGVVMDVVPAALPRLFNPRSVEAIVRAGGRGLAVRDRRIFALLVLGLWSQAYGGLD